MSDIIRKIGLFGIGAIALTTEKIEELSQELIEKGEMNKEEGKKFVSEVLQEKDKKIKEIGDFISYKVKETIDKSGLATKSDIEGVKERLDRMESNRKERIEKIKEELDTLEK